MASHGQERTVNNSAYTDCHCNAQMGGCRTYNFELFFKVEMKFVSKIDDAFNISGRGCIVVPGVPYTFEPSVVAGTAIEIRNPDGRTIRTQVEAFEMINRGRPMDSAPFLLPRDVTKQDIQIGAEIFLLDANEQDT